MVRDYLARVDDALADLPHREARELRDQIAAHIEDALPPDADDHQVGVLLERIGSPEEIAAEALGGRRRTGEDWAIDRRAQGGGGRRVRRWALTIGAVAIGMSAVALALSLTRGTSSQHAAQRFGVPVVIGLKEERATAVLVAAGFKVAVVDSASFEIPAGQVTSESPTDSGRGLPHGSTVTLTVSSGPPTKPPAPPVGKSLLSYVPTPTPPELVTSGRIGKLEWQFWAKVSSPGAPPEVFLPSASMVFQGVLSTWFWIANKHNGRTGGPGPRGDPSQLPRLVESGFDPGPGFPARVLMGMTSIAASSIRIDFVGSARSVTARTVTNKYFPNLWFFAVEVPTWHLKSVEALGKDGIVLYRASQPLP